jgi:membrane AbrB-like protein
LIAVLTLAIAAAGGVLFFGTGLPAPWLSGPAVFAGAAALCGVKVQVPAALRHTAMVALGAAMGATVTPETIGLMLHWPVSLAGLAVSVVSILLASSLYLERVHGYDRATARLAAVPGALPYVLALAAEMRCDRQRIAIVQMVRLTALVVLLPGVLSLMSLVPSAQPAGRPPVDIAELATLAMAGLVGAWAFTRIRLPAAPLFGAMTAGACLYGGGLLTSGIPQWAMVPGFVVIGATVGTNFQSLDRTMLADTLAASIGSLIVGALAAMLIALPVAWLIAAPVAKVWLAYAPGGSDAMTIMAIALGLEPAFVGAHHVARFFGLGLIVPFWMRGGLLPRDSN